MSLEEILKALQVFGRENWENNGHVLHYYATKALEDLEPEFLARNVDLNDH